MTTLLAITIGPVETFIAAARRTRDLWSGSVLLSEISKSIARVVEQEPQASLIFPHPDRPGEQLKAESDFSVSNIILAVVPQLDPSELARRCEAAANRCWRDYAREARRAVGDASISVPRWERQLNGVIEFYAAWEPLVGGYPQARHRVMRTLAARKACRDFEAWVGEAGIPKSTLDGRRESIWAGPLDQLSREARGKLRLSGNEQLDAVGLTKRIGLGGQQFPSVARVAGEHWVERNQGALGRLSPLAERVVPHGLTRYGTTRFPQYKRYPFEAAAIFGSELGELAELAPGGAAAIDALRRELADVQRNSRPTPYLAVLVADGDRMGATINELPSAESHRAFSSALAGFASGARTSVQNHRGALVFAGGDDVLAFLPIDTAVECAADLRTRFLDALRPFPGPTLSVGIGIGHSREPLEDLLLRARKAERVAKGSDRDGLAVLYAPRHQEGTLWRGRWTENAFGKLTGLVAMVSSGELPDSLPFAVGELAAHYRHWDSKEHLGSAIRADLRRVLTAKKSGISSRALAEWETLHFPSLASAADLDAFGRLLRVSRAISRAGEGR